MNDTHKWGDPTQMTAEERSAGHNEAMSRMDEDARELTVASGCVADHRRLVAFVYLVLRDNMPIGRLADVMRTYSLSLDAPTDPSAMLAFDGLAARLTHRVPLRVMRHWLVRLHSRSESPEEFMHFAEALPEADDTETVFTNGWAARYAQYVVDQLESHACPPE